MTYRERTKAVCASILLILKNATIVIPVIEGILYTVWDLIKPEKKEKQNEEKITDTTAFETGDVPGED